MKSRSFALLAATLLCSNPAVAGSAVTSMPVGATVEAACTVSATDLEFGAFSPFDGARDATASIFATCSNGTMFDLSLDAGTGTGATAATRRMTHATSGNLLDYGLYSDPARSEPWGDELKLNTIEGEGDGSTQQLVVYGRIPDPTLAAVGTFSDTITLTVSY
jgi:spore coat protein U-like protein